MQNTSDLFVRHYQQQPTMGGYKPDPIGGRNQEEALEVDRIHIEDGKKISVAKRLLHNFPLSSSPSILHQSLFISPQKDHSFNICTTSLTDNIDPIHYRLSQTFPFVLPTSKIRSSSLHLP
ncbi:unnamed protein product, partial [Schistosoma mattheei]